MTDCIFFITHLSLHSFFIILPLFTLVLLRPLLHETDRERRSDVVTSSLQLPISAPSPSSCYPTRPIKRQGHDGSMQLPPPQPRSLSLSLTYHLLCHPPPIINEGDETLPPPLLFFLIRPSAFFRILLINMEWMWRDRLWSAGIIQGVTRSRLMNKFKRAERERGRDRKIDR